jgi:hypothetical protein
VFDEKAIDILCLFWPGCHDNGKLCIGRVDLVYMPDGRVQYQAVMSHGAANRARLNDQPKGRFSTLGEAATAVDGLLRQAIETRYKRVGDPGFRGNVTWDECLAKIDTSFTVGFVQPPAKFAPAPAGQPVQSTRNHGGRANRKVQI